MNKSISNLKILKSKMLLLTRIIFPITIINFNHNLLIMISLNNSNKFLTNNLFLIQTINSKEYLIQISLRIIIISSLPRLTLIFINNILKIKYLLTTKQINNINFSKEFNINMGNKIKFICLQILYNEKKDINFIFYVFFISFLKSFIV